MANPPLTKYWVDRLKGQLYKNLFVEALLYYRVPDTRSRWKKFKDRLRYRTIGRFREWLHRDCGDY